MQITTRMSKDISELYDRLGRLKVAIKDLEKQAITPEKYEERASFLLDEVVSIIIEDLKIKPF